MLDYYSITSRLPSGMVFSLASLIFFYGNETRKKNPELNDDPEIIKSLAEWWSENNINMLVDRVMNMPLWKSNFDKLSGLKSLLTDHINLMIDKGFMKALNNIQTGADTLEHNNEDQ